MPSTIQKIVLEPNDGHFSATTEYPEGWNRYTPNAGDTWEKALTNALDHDQMYGPACAEKEVILDTPDASGKPHRGSLEHWRRMDCIADVGLGYYVVGLFVGHPQFSEKYGHTSYVVAHDGDQIETLNSRYTLVGDEHVIS